MDVLMYGAQPALGPLNNHHLISNKQPRCAAKVIGRLNAMVSNEPSPPLQALLLAKADDFETAVRAGSRRNRRLLAGELASASLRRRRCRRRGFAYATKNDRMAMKDCSQAVLGEESAAPRINVV
ncbi:hypothetical protein Aduo_015683 [Ancylostoma duodenale]